MRRRGRQQLLISAILLLLVVSRIALLLMEHHDVHPTTLVSNLPVVSSSIPPICQSPTPNPNITRLFFLHMRKAGGSTLRTYFKLVAEKYNLEFKAVEGSRDAELEERNYSNTLYVTVLREPIARIISNYKYDHRWDCHQLQRNQSFVPSLENQLSSIEDFVNMPLMPKHDFVLWECSSECYARWATQKYDLAGTSDREALYQDARRSIAGFNFTIISERLKDPKYVQSLERLFGVKGLVPQDAFCSKASREASEKVPLVVSNELSQQMERQNEIDTKLYNEFSKCQPNLDATPPLFQIRDDPKFEVSESRKREPFECLPLPTLGRNITRIFFLHMRKAAGTTVASFLERVTWRYNLEFRVVEGLKDDELLDRDYSNTIYVTALREPVARVLSHYKYDQRWDCEQLMHNHSFVPSEDNLKNTLDMFIYSPRKVVRLNRLWDCSSDCYARWATNRYDMSDATADSLLVRARKALSGYNLTIITERLKDESYRQSIERLFGMDGLQPRYARFCSQQSRDANEKVPLVVSNETIAEIKRRNQVDSVLYEEYASCYPDLNITYSLFTDPVI